MNVEREVTTVRELIDRMAATRAHAIFLVDPETGRELTFGSLQGDARESV